MPTSDGTAGGVLESRAATDLSPRGLAGAAGFLGASQAFQYLVRIATSLILARLFEPRDFGLLGIVGVLTVLLQRTVVDGGMVNALVQHKDVTQELRSSVFYLNIATGLATTTVLIVAAQPIATVLGDGSAAGVLRGVALSFLILGFAKVPEAALRRDMRYRALSLFGPISAVVTGAIAISMALAGHGVESMVVGQVAGTVVETVLALALARWRPSLHFSRADIRKVSRFSANMTAFNFVNYFSDAGDKFMVGRFVGTTALGYYNLPYRLLFAPVLALAQVFHDLFFPMFARRQHDPESIAAAYRRSVGVLALVTFPLCGIVAALGTPLVDTLLGPKWHPAGPILSVMAIVAMFQSVLVTSGVLLSSTGRTDILFRWGLVAGIVMPASYAAGIHWGAVGVAFGFLGGTVVLAYPALAVSYRSLGAPMLSLFASLWRQALATAVLGAVALLVRLALSAAGHGATVILVLGGLAGTLAYGVVILVIRPAALRDVLLVVRTRSSSPANEMAASA